MYYYMYSFYWIVSYYQFIIYLVNIISIFFVYSECLFNYIFALHMILGFLIFLKFLTILIINPSYINCKLSIDFFLFFYFSNSVLFILFNCMIFRVYDFKFLFFNFLSINFSFLWIFYIFYFLFLFIYIIFTIDYT